MSDEISDTHVGVTSIYGARTRRGLVQVTLGTETVLIPPAKAREIAGFLLEAAGAAEGDEAIMKVLERTNTSPQRQGQFLMALRSERSIIDRRAREEARRAVAFDQSNATDPDQPASP